MQFIRAPDENVYIPPFNLIEVIIAVCCEWWMSKRHYELVNDWIMGALYSPLLLVAAYLETRTAHEIRRNRKRGDADDDQVEEWEQMLDQVDFEGDGWAKTVESVKSNVEEEQSVLEIRTLRGEVEELKSMLVQVLAVVGEAKGKGKEVGHVVEKIENGKEEKVKSSASSSSSEEMI
jgi:hypothetical protein